jgi:Fe-S cluster biogenesis protein NfuA
MNKSEQIKEVLEGIRPMLQSDGGDLNFVSFDEDTGVVKVELKGACVGCPMANMTLKSGVETELKDKLDFVKSVVEK